MRYSFEIPDESPCPTFTASFDVPNAAVADDVLALPGGGFLVPMVRVPSFYFVDQHKLTWVLKLSSCWTCDRASLLLLS